MQFFWRDNRLQIQPSDDHERGLLAILAEQDGILRTSVNVAGPTEGADPELQLEVEIEKVNDRWIGRVPALSGVEYSLGVSEADAYNGVLIEAFKCMAVRLSHGRELPEQVSAWFTTIHGAGTN
jgi:hypothetical protein